MSIWSSVRSWFASSEHDVINFVGKVWSEAPVIESEIQSAFRWIANKGLPVLVADVQAITPVVSLVGDVSGHPELRAQMAVLNAAMASVNAFAANSNGTLTADQVVQGYGSLKQASAAAQQVISTAATIVAVTPASKP